MRVDDGVAGVQYNDEESFYIAGVLVCVIHWKIGRLSLQSLLFECR